VIFDIDRLVSFEGKTGAYLQYACVRIAAMLEKARQRNDKVGGLALEHAAERAVVLECLRLPKVVTSAAKSLPPSETAEYAFDVADNCSLAGKSVYAEPTESRFSCPSRKQKIASCGSSSPRTHASGAPRYNPRRIRDTAPCVTAITV
jgi:arginyl-tRNA synthetase